MSKILMFLFAIVLAAACKEGSINREVDQIAESTSKSAHSGDGKIELSCGTQLLSLEGECGGATTMGTLIIAVEDKIVPSRIFTISFNTVQFPENGSEYAIKKSDYTNEHNKRAADVYIGFSEVSMNNQMDWSSDDDSGHIKFECVGNEIKCTFKNIKLQPSEVYNKGELNQTAMVSGSFNLYKN